MLYNKLKILLLSACLLCFGFSGAQQIAVKTNLLSDALLNANLGIEAPIASRWSIDLSGELNAWILSDGKRWKHWLVQPEARYWLCQPKDGHFFGIHAMGGQYNIGGIDNLKDFLGNKFSTLDSQRYQGWFVGAGLAYGYSWTLSRHLSIEAEIGLGWAWSRYDIYPCTNCSFNIKKGKTHNYVGPTKAALNLVYVF